MSTYDHLLSIVAPHGQEHLLGFWSQLTAAQQQSLAVQIEEIDFDLVDRLYRGEDALADLHALADRAGSPPGFRLDPRANRFTPEQARQRGIEAIAAGRLGTILVAGGQGTRLGFDHPKGMFPIGPISQRPLFQIHVEKILALGRRHGVRIPLYLMTSHATHQETVDFFARNGRFGLLEDDLQIFCQGTMPAVDAASGKILLERPDRIFQSPDGHGGMLAALARSGALADMRGRGIEQLFYFQVDNPLVDVGNPESLGYHLLSDAEISTQVVAKQDPLEKVGNVVQVDGRSRIIEYSDLAEAIARRRKEDGSLAIWAGSIGVHVIQRSFLEKVADRGDGLPFHRAAKKVPYINAAGARVEPREPNAVKFERFIFDLLPWAAGAVVIEVDPQRSFAPLKNAPGAKKDTAEWVQAQMVALATEWLRLAGATVAEGVLVEINPLLALDAEELARKIRSGTRVTQSTYFQ
jgi:UDP-N-acetylglucosamine/UDP-N-acetylgalactosamine diphosphorylase